MNKRQTKHALQTFVPNPPAVFSQAMHSTLASIAQAEAQKEAQSMKRMLTKRKIMMYVIVAVILIASVALAAVLLHNNVFDYTMGTSPQNADTMLQENLAEQTIGNAQIKVTQAAYDGISLFITYSIRDLTAAEPLGVIDTPSGMRLLTMEDYNTIANLGVGWWVDHIWIDGQSVDMPNMSGGIDVGTDTPGEILYSMLYRLDQEEVYLDGEVQISLPIGERQPLDSLTIDRENNQTLMPENGMVTFTLDCSARDGITQFQPEWQTDGPRWSAMVSEAVFTPIQTYVTVDWAVHDDEMQAYITENGEGYADEDGNILWKYNGYDVVGIEVQSLQLVDENGVPVFDSMEGFYGNQGVGPNQAWFTFPYMETIPDPLYMAPTINGMIDMQYALRIR